VTWGSQDTQVTVTGTTPEYIGMRSAVGQFLSDVDVQRNNRVSALGAETARTLFGNRDPIGRKSASGTSFRVIGVMAKGAVLGRNQDEAVFVPLQQWLTSYRDEGLHVGVRPYNLGLSPRSGKYQRCPDYKPATPATQD